jgi:hypothetical protein
VGIAKESNLARLRFPLAAFFRDSDFPGSSSSPCREISASEETKKATAVVFHPPPDGTDFLYTNLKYN